MDENSLTYEFLNKNIYNKMKAKIFLFPIKAEYNIINNFLLEPNNLSIFFQKKINNIYCETSFINKNYQKQDINNKNNSNYFILFGENKNDRKGPFIVKTICKKQFINHSLLIIRFIKQNSLIQNDIKHNNDKSEEFLDSVISFYIDINDNSTVLINELYSNLSNELLNQFYKFNLIFYQQLLLFIKENMNKYYCFESILIRKNTVSVFNYLFSSKFFHNEKIQIKKIEKVKEDIIVSFQIYSIFPVNISESKLFLRKLSNNCCTVEIINWINYADFTIQGKILNMKSIVSFFLKKLRCKIIGEEAVFPLVNNNSNLNKKGKKE